MHKGKLQTSEPNQLSDVPRLVQRALCLKAREPNQRSDVPRLAYHAQKRVNRTQAVTCSDVLRPERRAACTHLRITQEQIVT